MTIICKLTGQIKDAAKATNKILQGKLTFTEIESCWMGQIPKSHEVVRTTGRPITSAQIETKQASFVIFQHDLHGLVLCAEPIS